MSPRSWLSEAGALLKETAIEWLEDGVPARGAALSYYVLLSLGPLLVLIVGGLQFFLTEERARSGVLEAVRQNIGPRAADTAETVLSQVEVPNLLAPESILTLVLLLFGATAVFANIRGSLNAIWGVEPEYASKREAVMDVLKGRVRSFVMILFAGLVLVISLLITAFVSVLAAALDQWLTNGALVAQLVDIGVSLVLTGLLFAAIYRTLPETRVEYRTVWVGAFSTALLFVIGKWLVALLISSASWTSYYGPGASVVAFLAWIYFSSQVFFLGAEFTQVWGRRYGGAWDSG